MVTLVIRVKLELSQRATKLTRAGACQICEPCNSPRVEPCFACFGLY